MDAIEEVAVIGENNLELLYDYNWLGDSMSTLNEIASGKHEFVERIRQAKRPVIILGQQVLKGNEHTQVYDTVRAISEKYGVELNVLHANASQVAAFDLGLKPSTERVVDTSGEASLLWLIGVDDANIEVPNNCFVIYQGHNGDICANSADVVLPGAAFTEKQGTYASMEGRVQQTQVAITPPNMARPDWKIIRAVSELANHTLPYDNLLGVRERIKQLAPHLVYGQSRPLEKATLKAPTASSAPGPSNAKLLPKLKVLLDYWQTDAISRSSSTMAKCVTATQKEFTKRGSQW
jgi:NADH dehydrogenase (ubiquinone) Fe-S protein 1